MEPVAYRVRFANGQGDCFCGSLKEARRVITRRAEYDPPPPGIFPAEIYELRAEYVGGLAAEQFIERFPEDAAGPP